MESYTRVMGTSYVKPTYTEDQLLDLFKFFDKDGSGEVPVSELKAVFQHLGFNEETAESKAKVSRSLEPTDFFRLLIRKV